MKKITLGSQIEKFRKRLGYSQEVLAEECGLNLRTIQRIEKDETVPRADSLKRITDALKVTPDELIDYNLVEDRAYLKILNISALGFLFFPLLGIILPLIFWIMKRDKIKDVDYIGKKILNFQITWSILLFSVYIFAMLPMFFGIHFLSGFIDTVLPSGAYLVYLPIGYYALNIVFIVLNEILIFSGKNVFYKPAFRFLK